MLRHNITQNICMNSLRMLVAYWKHWNVNKYFILVILDIIMISSSFFSNIFIHNFVPYIEQSPWIFFYGFFFFYEELLLVIILQEIKKQDIIRKKNDEVIK